MNFLELITGIEAGDQATSTEMVQARTMLADDIDSPIPDCIMGGVDGWRWDVIDALLFVRLKRENPKITQEQARALAHRQNQREIIEELLYFYGDSSRKQVGNFLDVVFSKEERGNCANCDHRTLASWLFCPACAEPLTDAVRRSEPTKAKGKKSDPIRLKPSSKA